MTLHKSKGLESKIVFFVGFSQGLCPHKFAIEGDIQDIEEERRLAYVGITRAQNKLYITSIDNFNDRKLSESIFKLELGETIKEVEI